MKYLLVDKLDNIVGTTHTDKIESAKHYFMQRKRIDESLDQFIAQAIDGYTSLEDLMNKLRFDKLQIIQQEAEDMGRQAG